VRIRESRRLRWGSLVIAVALVVCGCDRLAPWRHDPDGAKRLAEAATVAGFTRTAIIDEDSGANPPDAEVYFIGPAPKPNPLAVVSVPTIQLKAADSPPAEYTREHPDVDLPVATGERPDGCMAAVVFVSNPTSSVSSDFHGKHRVAILTDAQLATVSDHTATVIRLVVSGCGW
jgi:hypothetical protein